MRIHQSMLLLTTTSDSTDPIAVKSIQVMRKRTLDRLKSSCSTVVAATQKNKAQKKKIRLSKVEFL